MSYTAYHPEIETASKGVLALLSLPREPLEAHNHIMAGFSPQTVTKIAEMLGSDTKTICMVAGIDRTTLSRKAKSSALLSQDQSARVYWLAQVLDSASALNRGDWEKTMRWLNKPAWGLGNKKPIELLTTSAGAQAVINLIGKIRHGVIV